MKKTGGKCTSSHTTYIESANVFIKFANNSPLVTKISLGIIKGLPHSKGGVTRRIKYIKEKACLLLKIRGNRAIQEIRLFSNKIEFLEQEIIKVAKENEYKIT
jgi:hypothetical protein